MSRNASKNFGEAITGAGDLVSDVKAGRQKLAAVKDDDLPDNVRKMNAAERQGFIDKQVAERNKLNERMAALVKQRDAYARDQARKGPTRTADSFDRAVEETLRVQIK
jgi:C4-dicarboxylate-specific signal transduction histidine kinase